MNVKVLFASAALAAALPLGTALASGSATLIGGPQGTGYYGFIDPLDINRDGRPTGEPAGAGATAPAEVAVYDRNRDGVISLEEYTLINESRAGRPQVYSGPSWATNPPAPPQ